MADSRREIGRTCRQQGENKYEERTRRKGQKPDSFQTDMREKQRKYDIHKERNG